MDTETETLHEIKNKWEIFDDPMEFVRLYVYMIYMLCFFQLLQMKIVKINRHAS